MSINKDNLQKQIEEMKVKLANMEAELNKPDVVINYWQPAEREYYYYVDYFNDVERIRKGFDEYNSNTRYRVFKTKAEAEKYAEYIKAEETLRRVIAEANEGWIPDWGNLKEEKCVIYLGTKQLEVFYFTGSKSQPSFMYIKSAELAEKLKKEYEKEFITYLSY